MRANQPLLDRLHHFADEKEATPAQISLAWMLNTQDYTVPAGHIAERSGVRAMSLPSK